MAVYIARRILLMVPLLLGITIISFLVVHLAPGEPTDMMTDLNPKASLEAKARLHEMYGLDQHLHVQYWRWVTRLARLDFGTSFSADRRPVLEKTLERVPVTIGLKVPSELYVFSIAKPCADARKMVDETIAVPPKAGTDEILQTALKQCPGKPEVYHLIGDYYNNWWKKDINPEKKATYNYLATEYYAKGIKLGKGKEVEAIRRKLAALESSTEDITEVGIRSIKPGARLNIRVFFEFNSSALSKEAQDELDVLGRYLGDVKSSRIVLEGHTIWSGVNNTTWHCQSREPRAPCRCHRPNHAIACTRAP